MTSDNLTTPSDFDVSCGSRIERPDYGIYGLLDFGKFLAKRFFDDKSPTGKVENRRVFTVVSDRDIGNRSYRTHGLHFFPFFGRSDAWKECSVMDERCSLWLAASGEAIGRTCREFAISRKTGYKIFDRYQECGVQG